MINKEFKMNKEKYNCLWSVDFLPNRTELYVTSRNSNEELIFEMIDIKPELDSVIEYLEQKGIKVFNYQDNTSRSMFTVAKTFNFSGKGVINA
jgi:hypothetical protein